ncbi:MAG TPA: periplasmic heavy metal sensor [Armatimonadota bacterium]
MKKRFIIPALALGIALIAGTLLWAQGGQPKGQGRPGGPPPGQMRPMSMMQDPMFSDLTTTLSLSAAQAKKVKAIQDSTKKAMMAHAENIKPIREKLATAMKADKPDLKTINKLIADSGQEQIASLQAYAAGIVKIKAMLTKAQLKKFPESPMFAGHFRMGGGMGGGMHGGPHMRGGQPPAPPAGKK